MKCGSGKLNILHLISSLKMGGAEKLLIALIKQESEQNGCNQSAGCKQVYGSEQLTGGRQPTGCKQVYGSEQLAGCKQPSNSSQSADCCEFVVVVINNAVDENLRAQLVSNCRNVYFLNRPEGRKNPKYIFQLLTIIKRHNVNIIHSHNYGSKMWSVLCKLIMPMSKLKLVFTIHSSNLFQKMNRWALALHRHLIDLNIAISKTVAIDCTKYGIKKYVLISNGIDIKSFAEYTGWVSKDGGILKIINISRLDLVNKGQDILINALAVCARRGLNFYCCIAGEPHYKDHYTLKYLKNMVREQGLESKILFLGQRNDIAKLLRENDLFILPSRHEGFGIALIEAMASGIPVIASNADGPGEIIRHGENGLLFKSEDISDLAEKIIYAGERPEEIKRMAENASRDVWRYDISVMHENYIEAYKLLGEG